MLGQRQQPSAELGHSSISNTVSADSLQPSVWFVLFVVQLCFLKHILKNVAVETCVPDFSTVM